MNEEVLKMIRTLHARLDDVEAAVKALPSEQAQFAKQLDKVDDKLYLIQCEVEKLIPAADAASAAQQSEEKPADANPAEQGEQAAEAPEASNGDAAASAGTADAPVDDVETVGASKSAEGEGDEKPLISDEMKDNLKDAGRALGGILKESKDVVTELSGTMNDLKSAFKFK